MGYVYDAEPMNNKLGNKFLIGAGTGIDWVTYYDIVIRTECSFNRFGEVNFNMSFVAPI
jgi:hypothetical protein